MSDANKNDDLQSGPGSQPVGVPGIVLVSLYLFVIANVCSFGLWENWPSCPPESPATDVKKLPTLPETDPKNDKKDPKPGSAPLRITSIEPDSGSARGQECVTLLGINFTEKDVVIFGGIPVTTHFKGSGMLVVESPPHGPGKVHVVVHNTQGTTQAGVYTYTCPGPDGRILFLMVMMAGALGGTIHGFLSLVGYVGDRQFKRSWILHYLVLPVNSSLIALVFFLIVRAGFYTPQGTDNYLLMVGLAALVGLFSPQSMEKLKQVAEAVLTKVPPRSEPRRPPTPALSSLEPAGGRLNQPVTNVALLGTGFNGAKEVLFGALPATSFQVEGDTKIRATAPVATAAGKVKVTVMLADNSKAELPDGFSYEDMALVKVEQNSGPAAAPTEVAIEGRGFHAAVRSVMFGAQAATKVKTKAPTKITAVPPAGTAGQAVNVVVTLVDGQTLTLSNGFSYT